MSATIGTAVRGLIAGVLGVVGMAGASFTMRRFVQPNAPIGDTHYVKVVESARAVVSPDAEPLDPDLLVRLGEVAHLAFGGFWGVAYAVARQHRGIKPLIHGVVFGTAVWALAFGGYMPKLKISRGIADMDAYEAARTWVCHVTYAATMALLVEQLRRPANR